jgi:uncharacterized protein (DUF433 family)
MDQADPRNLPTYTAADAARILRMPPATLRSWLFGRDYETVDGARRFARLIEAPPDPLGRLSFINLIEAHVLRALRTRHGVSMRAVRRALDYAQDEFGIDRLLVHEQLKAAPGRLFLDEYGTLVELPQGGQLALRQVFQAHLERVLYDVDNHLPIRLFPWFPIESDRAKKTIALDPRISFGDPVTDRRGIRTAIIADRFEAGETIAELAHDYDLRDAEIEDAILFERAA